MPEIEKILEVVRGWVIKADNDLKTAALTVKGGKNAPTDTICFHTQQCIEKYLKALLTFKNMDFPKTHDIERLLDLLPADIDLPLSVRQQRQFTNYATTARYPGGCEEISMAEAKQALQIARRIRKEIRTLFGESLKKLGKSA